MSTQCEIYGITQVDRYSFNMFTIGHYSPLSLLAFARLCASISPYNIIISPKKDSRCIVKWIGQQKPPIRRLRCRK